MQAPITYCPECGRNYDEKDHLQSIINEAIDNTTPPEVPDDITREQYHQHCEKLKRHIKVAVANKLREI